MSCSACTEFTAAQGQIYQGAVEIYRAYLDSLRQGRALQGGMHWKKIRGREYLYRYRDRRGNGKSLGRRSESTERLYADFTRERREVAAALQGQRLRLEEQARFCRAALIHRVPRALARILRRLEQDEQGQNLLVIGTAALHAYEFAAKVFLKGWWGGPPCPPNLPPRRDACATNKGSFQGEAGGQDLWADSRRGLTLAGDGRLSRDDLLRLLRQADRSFAPVEGEGCALANRAGFLVKLLKSGDRWPGKRKAITVPGAGEPLPPEAGQLQGLAASPKLSQVVIGWDGWPATMVVPDPRAFALNKLWWSQQEDREASRRARDYRQALAVAELVLRHLPQYDYSSSDLAMFPQDLVRRAARFSEGSDFSEDVTIEY